MTPNRPILEEALEIRRRIGQLFGMPTWAHYALEVKMAGSPERVEEFYARDRAAAACRRASARWRSCASGRSATG